MKEKIKTIFKKYKIDINDEQAAKFEQYYDFLIEENKKYNLTAITNQEDAIIKHFLDSVLVVDFLDKGANVIDVGSGAGFPGIPIKILRPDLNMVLLDSLQKRVLFLNSVIEMLQLKNITAIHMRAEEFAEKNREKFDYALSRAVAQTNTLCEYLLPLVKIGGKAVLYKSNKLEEEIESAKKAIDVLGGNIDTIKNFEIKENLSKRSILFIKKCKKTPKIYPRGKNLPKTNPIK